jgi:hypothetical protein
MMVGNLIARLQRDYKPTDEIFVAWWDIDVLSYDDATNAGYTNKGEFWHTLVERLDETVSFDYAYQEIRDVVNNLIDEGAKRCKDCNAACMEDFACPNDEGYCIDCCGCDDH